MDHTKTYLLNSADQNRQATTDNKLNETEESRSIDINNKIYYSFHDCERKDERGTRSVHR